VRGRGVGEEGDKTAEPFLLRTGEPEEPPDVPDAECLGWRGRGKRRHSSRQTLACKDHASLKQNGPSHSSETAPMAAKTKRRAWSLHASTKPTLFISHSIPLSTSHRHRKCQTRNVWEGWAGVSGAG
jgi:hypothetical protein